MENCYEKTIGIDRATQAAEQEEKYITKVTGGKKLTKKELEKLVATLEVEMKEVTAANGTHTRVRLPDGSIVTLNAGSTLSYSTAFNLKNRNVSLEGEGYFEVMSNPELPFVVSASGCKFTVLGTKFNISSYDSDKLASAALIQGSLLVSGTDASVLMVPGEITEIDKSDGSLTKFKGDVSEYSSWVKGILRFDHITLPELVARLSREYNAGISLLTDDFNDTGLRISFNLRVPLGVENLSATFQHLALALSTRALAATCRRQINAVLSQCTQQRSSLLHLKYIVAIDSHFNLS